MRWTVLIASFFFPAAAMAQSMNAQSFHERATRLEHKGMLALFSGGEIKTLMGEAKAAGATARERRLAAIKVGQPSRYCPPTGVFSMDNKEFMARLSAIAAADRARIDMTEAMTRIFAAKFPCPR